MSSKKQLKKDFGSDAAAAKRFALDFKKLRADLVSVKAVRTAQNRPHSRGGARAGQRGAAGAAGDLHGRQAELARQVASARRDEAVDHGAALVTLKGTINQEGFALRKATEETLRRARKTVSLLASFQFRLVRALDLYTLAPFRGDARYAQGAESSLVRYDYAYVPPDRLADYAESKVKDLEPANTLLAALNSTFDLHEVTLNVREMRRNYRLEHAADVPAISLNPEYSARIPPNWPNSRPRAACCSAYLWTISHSPMRQKSKMSRLF